MRRQSEALLILALLPIFFLGLLPMLLFGLLGFAGLGIAGVLLVCIGMAEGLQANSDFNRQVIVHGYARQSERAAHASHLRSAIRFKAVMSLTGALLSASGLFGFFYFG
jgi:hypothetical protein